MGHRIVQLVSTIREGTRLASRVAGADYKVFRKVGYNRRQSAILSGSIAAGGSAKYLSSDNGIEPDAPISFKNGFKASKSYKTRSRQSSYTSRRRKRKFSCGPNNRYSYSRRY